MDIHVAEHRELEKQVEGSQFMEEIDLLLSPIDGALVVVAQDCGVHVCTCRKPVNFKNGVETHFGYARVLLHPDCARGKKRSFFFSSVDIHQTRRRLTKIVKGSAGIAAAARGAVGRIL